MFPELPFASFRTVLTSCHPSLYYTRHNIFCQHNTTYYFINNYAGYRSILFKQSKKLVQKLTNPLHRNSWLLAREKVCLLIARHSSPRLDMISSHSFCSSSATEILPCSHKDSIARELVTTTVCKSSLPPSRRANVANTSKMWILMRGWKEVIFNIQRYCTVRDGHFTVGQNPGFANFQTPYLVQFSLYLMFVNK
jgi:hypothetical protein